MSTASPRLRRLLWGLGMLWTSPNTLIGLFVGSVACAFGARIQLSIRDGALVFTRFPWGPGGAITFGNVILATAADLDGRCRTYAHRAGLCVDPLMRIGSHESAHVRQYMVLGPLFLPVYLLLGGVSVRNPLERAADRFALAGQGWWPWSKVEGRRA